MQDSLRFPLWSRTKIVKMVCKNPKVLESKKSKTAAAGNIAYIGEILLFVQTNPLSKITVTITKTLINTYVHTSPDA